MAIKAKPEQYETTDGRTFATEQEAQWHEDLWQACREFDRARVALGKLLAQREKTADGHNFDLSHWEHWHVLEPANALPRLVRFRVDRWNFRCAEDRGVLTVWAEGENPRYRISELYRDYPAAAAAELEAQERWLREQAEAIAERKAARSNQR